MGLLVLLVRWRRTTVLTTTMTPTTTAAAAARIIFRLIFAVVDIVGCFFFPWRITSGGLPHTREKSVHVRTRPVVQDRILPLESFFSPLLPLSSFSSPILAFP